MDPVRTLGKRLLAAEKPARYLGGEHGASHKDGDLFTIALCFPDLYEIGMSNNAIRILYTSLNALPNIRCERVFAPAPDFESILRKANLTLYTLESGIPLCDVDMLAFSIGYELCATNILTVLDLGGISLDAKCRSEDAPIVIAGGPAITNPHPLARFLDAVWIGEAEAGFFSIVNELSELKKNGIGRRDLLERLRTEKAIWMEGKKAYRAVDMAFSERVYNQHAFPWPSVKPVQDHGTVEIMRGCPNGCRFCHAGYFYRPQRVRSPEKILMEIKDLVENSGYREITLASLSSGDYPELPLLIRDLNRLWAPRKVSFQLPSLKVESFSLPVLSELANTRKSGLTFAVETPEEAWQRVINKNVTLEKILAILEEARLQGYRLAKFYFMIGLPVPESDKSETEALANFLHVLLRSTSFQLNVNIGTFIPKPHTPFQWCRQIDEEESLSRINSIRNHFRSERRLKISYHSPFVSTLEGLLSRGDERVGDLVLKAWEKGARLDAWEDYLNKDIWREALSSAPAGLISETLGERTIDSALPWDDISINVSKPFLIKELEKSQQGVPTLGCTENCTMPCGVCGSTGTTVIKKINPIIRESMTDTSNSPVSLATDIFVKRASTRAVFRFEKTGSAAYLSHHSIIEMLYRTLQLINLPIVYSEGFNPLPRVEIEEPIPLGMESLDDYFVVYLSEDINTCETVKLLNTMMPSGFVIYESLLYPIQEGKRVKSLSSLYWGSEYKLFDIPLDMIPNLKEFLNDSRLEGSSIEIKDEHADAGVATLILRLRAGGNRSVGFGSLFQKTFGSLFSNSLIRVQRIKQFSDCGNGPTSFIEALNSLSM